MAIHVVNTGDTLWSISLMYKIDMTRLMTINGLNSSKAIVPGLALYIPDHTLRNRLYYIKPGDTLFEIANVYGTNVQAIQQANPGMELNNLQINQKISVPSPYKNQLITLGFAFPVSGGTVFNNLEKHSYQLTYLAIVAYSFTNEGIAYVDGDDRPLLEKSKQVGVKPLLMIRNFQDGDFNAELVGTVLANPVYRNNLVRSMMNFIEEKGYSGVSMDIEFIPPARRGDYVLLLRELKNALGNRILHVNLHSKTNDNFTNRIVGGHDYRAIGQVADLVAIMTIDYGYPTGPPNPISPLWWMAQVIRYALANIPSNKLQIAMPLYAYDWMIPSNTTTATSVNNAQNQAIVKWSEIEYDQAAASPWYTYWEAGIQHIVWFEDIRSITAKYEMIDGYRLAGITFWHIGLSFPQNWMYMNDNILVLK
ncbi:glycosyl hydrolase family 18 protein [Bacillus cihuensis]|uniref:glycosyl hydrolase family 18 protein n=1 Tax=Bacillus cihuensis TaxID=1208599 RepID=UPI0004163227|nr:glycosyl hydrolase family 18 protein [Bacillus cihuensis]